MSRTTWKDVFMLREHPRDVARKHLEIWDGPYLNAREEPFIEIQPPPGARVVRVECHHDMPIDEFRDRLADAIAAIIEDDRRKR